MKICYTLVLLFAAILTLSPSMVQAEEDYHLGFRIAPRISTLGGGLEVAKGLTPLALTPWRSELLHLFL